MYYSLEVNCTTLHNTHITDDTGIELWCSASVVNCGECDRKKNKNWQNKITRVQCVLNFHLSAYISHKWQLHVCAPCTRTWWTLRLALLLMSSCGRVVAAVKEGGWRWLFT